MAKETTVRTRSEKFLSPETNEPSSYHTNLTHANLLHTARQSVSSPHRRMGLHQRPVHNHRAAVALALRSRANTVGRAPRFGPVHMSELSSHSSYNQSLYHLHLGNTSRHHIAMLALYLLSPFVALNHREMRRRGEEEIMLYCTSPP